MVNQVTVLAARAYFAVAFLTCLSTLWVVCHVVQALGSLFGLQTERQRNEVCIRCAQFCFRSLMLAPCWWIKFVGLDDLVRGFHEAFAASGTPYVLSNHNSMVDSLVGTAIMPPAVSSKMRSLIKLALFSEPLYVWRKSTQAFSLLPMEIQFGYICSAVGHFPVLFTSSKANDFSVDKEAQAKVTEQLDQFIGSGGGLMIFPEGQLNSTPRKLQQFRRGAFALPIKHSRPIYALLNVGCEKMWPKGQPIGGFPADIHVKFFKVCDDASKFDAATLADHSQQVMQAELDRMYAAEDAAACAAPKQD